MEKKDIVAEALAGWKSEVIELGEQFENAKRQVMLLEQIIFNREKDERTQD